MIIGKGQYTITDVYDGDSFYRAWADTPDGSVNFSTTDSNRLYMGVYSGREAPDSPSDYQWTKVRGDSAVVAVLSNDSHQIGTDTNGQNGNYTGAQTTLTILRGGDVDTDNWEVSVSTFPEGSIKGTYTASTFTYTVEEMAADEGQVVFQALPKTGSDSPIEKVFSLSKNKQGQAGEDAKSYHLTVNDTAVKKNRLTRELEPEEVVITGNSITGSGVSQAEDGYFKIYTQSETAMGRDDYEDAFYDTLLDPEETYTLSDNMHPLVLTYTSDQPESELTYTFTDLIDVMSFKVYWYKDSGFEKLLDTQTIVVVSDGIDGTSIVDVSEYYLLTSSLERPNKSDDWKENEPMTPTGDLPYLWNYETVHYSDGSTSDTLPVILAMYSKDGTSLTDVREYYALSSTTDQPTESAFTNELKVTTPEQKYLWNKEVLELTHDDGSITEKTHYAIIGVHGEEGKQGVPGPPGKNGRSQYVHIRYSPNASGNPNTTVPNVNTEYIGLATTFNETETSQTLPYTSYSWSKYRGEDGEDGPAGMDADDKFTWVKYAEDDKGTNMSNFPEGKKYIGLAFNKLTPEESDNLSDYQWASMYDEEGMRNVSIVDKDKVSGTTLYTDKADDSVVHVKVDGKSYQHAGSGKNLFILDSAGTHSPYMDILERTSTSIKLNFKSGYLTVSNPAYIPNSVDFYTFSGYIKVNGSIPSTSPLIGNHANTYGSEGSGYTYNPETGYFHVTQKVSNGSTWFFHTNTNLETGDVVELSELQLEKGTNATEYEPPAPTPDYPIEIYNLNDFDVVSQVNRYRNIAKNRIETIFGSGSEWVQYQNSEVIENKPVEIKGMENWNLRHIKANIDSMIFIDGGENNGEGVRGGNYTLAVYVKNIGNTDMHFGLNGHRHAIARNINLKDGSLTSDSTVRSGEEILHLLDFTHRTDYNFWQYSIRSNSDNIEIIMSDVMIFEGRVGESIVNDGGLFGSPLNPEEVTEDDNHPNIDKINLSLSEPLRSVGDVKDRLFRDSDGLWKVERKTKEVHMGSQFKASQDFTIPETPDGLKVYYVSGYSDLRMNGNTTHINSTHFSYNPENNQRSSAKLNHVGMNGASGLWAHNLLFVVSESSFPTLASFNEWLVEEENNGTPVTLQVQLRPEDVNTEVLDQEFQDKLNSLRSFQGSNYVYTVLSQEVSPSVEKNLHPTLHGTFKGGGWYDRWKTQKELDTKPSYEELGDDTSKVVISGGNITAGTIASQNEYSKIDLDDGSFSFGNGALTWDGGTLRIGRDNSLQSDIDEKATPDYVDNKASTAERNAKAHADAVSKAEAELAEAEAKAYADGKVTAEEQARIDEAKRNLEVAKEYAENKAGDSLDRAMDYANDLDSIHIPDTRNTNESPEWYRENYKRRTVNEFKHNSAVGIGSARYGVLITTVPWNDSSGGGVKQLYLNGEKTYYREGSSNDLSWKSWNTLEDTEGAKKKADNAEKEAKAYAESAKKRTDAWSWNNTVEIDGGAIRAKTIRAEAITTNTLDSISANLGTIRAGRILSNDNAIDINLDTGLINLRKPIKILNRPVQTDQDVERAIDGIEFGVRNYLLDSEYLEATGGSSNHTFAVGNNGYIEINSTAGGGYISNLGFNKSRDLFNSNVEVGETYTVSFAVRSLDGSSSTIDYYDNNAFYYNRMEGEMSDKFSRFHITGVKVNSRFSMHMRFNDVGKFEIKEAKLEKGNKSTDWTPAPEDVQAYADKVAEAKSELAEAEAKAYADGKVTAEEQARINDAKAKLAEAKRHADSKASTAETNSKDYAERQVNDLEVGGRNLLRESNILYENTGYPVATYELTEPILDNTEVTLSIKGDLGRRWFGIYNSGGSVSMTTIFPADKRDGVYEKTFKWRIGASKNESLYVYPMPSNTGTATTIEWVKLEKGNKATDWTEAPEDTHKVIDDKTQAVAEENLSQLDQEISSVRADADASYAKSEDFEAFQSEVTSSFETTNQGFEMNFKENKDLISQVEGQLEQLDSEIEKYIRFENGKIKLGAAGSETEIIISNESIDFMQGGGEPVAYIEGQEMKINRGIFVDSATIAGFKFENVSGDPDVLGITWTS